MITLEHVLEAEVLTHIENTVLYLSHFIFDINLELMLPESKMFITFVGLLTRLSTNH